MTLTRFQKATRALIATLSLAALGLLLPASSPAQAAGLRNCVDVTGRSIGRVGCYEDVWVDGAQYTMTFSNQQFSGATPEDKVAPFYVLAPQTDMPQGTLPFLHDHVVASVPAQNQGNYNVHLRGYFVLCSFEGISTGRCVPTMTSIEGFGTVPFATTVDGEPLTSVEPIEAAAAAGLVSLFDTGGVLIGSLNMGE